MTTMPTFNKFNANLSGKPEFKGLVMVRDSRWQTFLRPLSCHLHTQLCPSLTAATGCLS